MIVVLADDLSGAAELAGVALGHGLTAEVQTVFHPATQAEVICLDTDTRLRSPDDAAARVGEVTHEIVQSRPEWIFKKCDSVLRGPVLAEARAAARAAGKNRIVLIPANPSHGRVIRDQRYYIGDRPLHETGFARDPLHPRHTSHLTALLGGDLAGVFTPDVVSSTDLLEQASALDRGHLPVGAADFFGALLVARVPRKETQPLPPFSPGPRLLVCGSAAAWTDRLAHAQAIGLSAFALPHDVPAITQILTSSGKALVGIGNRPAADQETATSLSNQLALTIARILAVTPVSRLLIEGGATAAAVLRTLGWNRLIAAGLHGHLAVLQPVAAPALQLGIKPGSYAWPESWWP